MSSATTYHADTRIHTRKVTPARPGQSRAHPSAHFVSVLVQRARMCTRCRPYQPRRHSSRHRCPPLPAPWPRLCTPLETQWVRWRRSCVRRAPRPLSCSISRLHYPLSLPPAPTPSRARSLQSHTLSRLVGALAARRSARSVLTMRLVCGLLHSFHHGSTRILRQLHTAVLVSSVDTQDKRVHHQDPPSPHQLYRLAGHHSTMP